MASLDGRMAMYKMCTYPALLGALLIVILLPLSFSNVEYHEAALYQQKSTNVIDKSKVYTSGRYFLGPDATFVKFPISEQTVQFTGAVFTKVERQTADNVGAGGTSVDLDISFQYRLKPEEIGILFATHAISYREVIQGMATAAIRNLAANFTAVEWTQERKTIQDHLFEGVNAAIQTANAECVLLQLRKVQFPPYFIERMLAAAVQTHSNQAEESLQVSQLIRSNTAFDVKQIENDASVLANTAKAEAALRVVQSQKDVQAEKNAAEEFKQQATLTRYSTEKDVADIKNEATLVTSAAEAEAQKLISLAKNSASQKLDQARTHGLKSIYEQLNITSDKHKASVDYIFKLISASESELINFEGYIGMSQLARVGM
mmetsp:Transcript_67941/g.99395  ORF Transcript_67941/g.99395 Transcript_67941/m.99395 type:complete len:375 (-) Transcript_67941:312-1436(-)